MANFTTIVDKTLNFEGGYQAFPNDSANYNSLGQLVGTNRGISAIAYETYLGFPPTVTQIKAITPAIAKAVYKKLFWDKMQGDAILNDSVAHIMFDSYIATGNLKLNRKGILQAGGNVDQGTAAYNNYTVGVINALNPQTLFDKVKQLNIDQRIQLATDNPQKYGAWLQGWLNRLNAITFSDVVTEVKKKGPVIIATLFFCPRFITTGKTETN